MPDRIKLFMVHKPPHNRYLEETLKSGMYAEGPRAAELEKKMGDFVGSPYAALVNSGTSALHLALHLCELKAGDIVITTPITSPATNISIPHFGAQIAWADVDAKSGNIDPGSVGRLLDKFGKKVKAVIGVNWGGMPIDTDALKKVINGRAALIEDAAHALGATYKNHKVGVSGADFTCFSFQAIKHMTTGDGGMLTCAREGDWQRAKRLRWFGIDRAKPGRAWDDDLLEAGYKFHMNDIAASIGLAQFEDLPALLSRRSAIAAQYENALPKTICQSVNYEARSAYWLFTLKIKNRALLIKSLDAIGVDASPVHRRNDTYTAFKNCTVGSDELKNAEIFDSEMLCIPVGEWVSDADVAKIIEIIKKHCAA